MRKILTYLFLFFFLVGKGQMYVPSFMASSYFPYNIAVQYNVATGQYSSLISAININGTYTIWMRYKLASTAGKIFLDFRETSGTGFLQTNATSGVYTTSGTKYLDGVSFTNNISAIDNNWHELTISGMTIIATNMYVAATYTTSAQTEMGLQEMKMASGTLTPAQMAAKKTDLFGWWVATRSGIWDVSGNNRHFNNSIFATSNSYVTCPYRNVINSFGFSDGGFSDTLTTDPFLVSGTGGWTALGTNAISNAGGYVKVTYGNQAAGASGGFRKGGILTKTCANDSVRISIKAWIKAGGDVNIRVYNGASYIYDVALTSTPTVYNWTIFVPSGTGQIIFSGFQAGEEIYLDDVIIFEEYNTPIPFDYTAFDGDFGYSYSDVLGNSITKLLLLLRYADNEVEPTGFPYSLPFSF
jgi:hypothetical protein